MRKLNANETDDVNEVVLESFKVISTKLVERLRHELNNLASRKINVEIRLVHFRPRVGNMSSSHRRVLGEIFIQLKHYTSNMSNLVSSYLYFFVTNGN